MCSFEIQYAKAMEYYEQIKEASDFLKSRIPTFIKDAVILGTGLGDFVESVDIEDEIPYGEIPNFPVSTVESHDGKLIVGTIKNKRIIVFSGRFHYYEGYSMKELTLPIRVLAMMGVENLFLTNVSGGINEDFEAGDLVMIKDHINMMPENPLRGPNDDRLGPRFPDMKNTYSEVFCNKALSIAKRLNLQLKSGIYYALQPHTARLRQRGWRRTDKHRWRYAVVQRRQQQSGAYRLLTDGRHGFARHYRS